MATTTITSVQQLVGVLSTAKCGGQFVTIYGETDQGKKYNKFPTDGSERIKRDETMSITKRFSVTYNFGTDYDKKMSKILGEEYHAHDANRIHLLKNVIMQYVSTGNSCLIYIDGQYRSGGTFVNGEPITEEQKAYLAKYASKAKKSASVLEYRTLSLCNVKEIHINKEVYVINITKPTRIAI